MYGVCIGICMYVYGCVWMCESLCMGSGHVMWVVSVLGTSDEHLSLVSLLASDGAVVVTTPQEASLQDVRKEINFW